MSQVNKLEMFFCVLLTKIVITLAISCPYGDLIAVSSSDIGNVITLPYSNMNCSAVFQLLASSNYDPALFCFYSLYTFGTTCCRTCSRNYIYKIKIKKNWFVLIKRRLSLSIYKLF